MISFKMLSGRSIPSIGLGTYLIQGRSTNKIIDEALSLGYRVFDTAAMYNNETDLGLAFKELLPKHNLKREDIFIQTKLYPSDHGDKAYGAIKTSLENLQCDYVDLYLIHWPGVYGVSPRSKENLKRRTQSWAAMVKAKDEGLVKDIGVSNYTVSHLKQLLENCYGVKPVVNQVEWHPSCYQEELKSFCDAEGIVLQAYMPLGSSSSNLLTNRVICGVAKKLGKTPAQIVLRWSLQQNVAVIPKASSREHLKDNLDVNFVIPETEMAQINTKISREKYDWDPTSIA